MARTKAEQLVFRYGMLKTKRITWDLTWQELADYILPKRSRITKKKTLGAKQTELLFDSTAPDAVVKLAAFISGSLTNMAIRWFSLKFRAEALNQIKDVGVWLEVCAEQLYLTLRQSNFNTESQELYTDLSAFGTACMLVEEYPEDDGDFGGVLFRTEAIGSYVIAEDARGQVDTVMREIELTIRAAADKWGIENLHESRREKLDTRPDDIMKILHVVMPRSSAPGKRFAKNKPFASYYIDLERNHLIDEGGYDELPFVVVRWAKTSGEEYGRGPGHTALPDIKTLNKADELTLRGWAKIIAPALKVRDDGVLGRVNTSPDAINIVRDKDALVPLEQGGRWDVNAALTADRRASIRRIFFADQLQLPDKTIVTATEVERRLELMQQILGPTVGRLEYEYLNPLVSRLFKIMLRAGTLPPPPPDVVQYAQQFGLTIDVEYEGPLARAQRGGEVQALNRFVQTALQLVQANPKSRIFEFLDDDAAALFLARVVGLPPSILRDMRDVQAMRQQEAAMAQQAQQMQALQAVGSTTRDMAAANLDLVQSGEGVNVPQAIQPR